MTEKQEFVKSQRMQVSSTPAITREIAATELRPWGSFTILEEGRGYKIKRVEVKPGHRLSLQMHNHRSEHWIVVSGRAKVVCGDEELFLSSNQSTYVPPSTVHRLENPGAVPLVLIEVQNGEYLEEDDIIRFADDYGGYSSPTNFGTSGQDEQKAPIAKTSESLELRASTLIKSLSSKEAQIRTEAALALGRLGVEEAIPALCEILATDQDPEVRRSAAKALGMIGSDELDIES